MSSTAFETLSGERFACSKHSSSA